MTDAGKLKFDLFFFFVSALILGCMKTKGRCFGGFKIRKREMEFNAKVVLRWLSRSLPWFLAFSAANGRDFKRIICSFVCLDFFLALAICAV